MKNITEYINEATSNSIEFAGHTYQLDVAIKTQCKTAGKEANALEYDAQIKSKEDVKSLAKSGCKYVLAYPPHKGTGGDVDYYFISMFIKSKKYHDMYMGAQRQVLINTKTGEIENEKNLQKEGKDWKVLRLD